MRTSLLIIMFYPFVLFAGVADLSIELEFDSTNGIVLERNGVFEARITNNGPDIAADGIVGNPIAALSTIIQDNGTFTPEVHFAPALGNDPNCIIFFIIGDPPPGGGLAFAYSLVLPSLEVNQTIACRVNFTRNFRSGTRSIDWNIRNTFDTDPDNSNDSESITFGIPPQPVDAFGKVSLLIMILMAWGMGLKYRQERLLKQ